MSRYETFDRSRLQLRSLEERGCDLWEPNVAELASPQQPLDCESLRQVALAIREATQNLSPVIVMIGGHPIKLGLSRFLIDLMERGLVTHLATNGAGLIHDFELALHGGTSEDVAKWIKFGLWQETGHLNDIVTAAASNDEGLGEGLGRAIESQKLPQRDISIAAAAWRCGVPVTSHVSIGSDIIHGYANCDGAALGKVTHTDFLILAKAIQNLEGGVFLNIGSAVTGPEVYLKALSMARNTARQSNHEISHFTTAVTLASATAVDDDSTGERHECRQRSGVSAMPGDDRTEVRLHRLRVFLKLSKRDRSAVRMTWNAVCVATDSAEQRGRGSPSIYCVPDFLTPSVSPPAILALAPANLASDATLDQIKQRKQRQ